MPRHILQASPDSEQFTSLIATLAQELKSDSGASQPLILEKFVKATGIRNVSVVWEAWKAVPEDARGDVILAAYETSEGKEYADTILVAEGYTSLEAANLGMLPYRVSVKPDKAGPFSRANLNVAFKAEATATVLGSKAKELRYARREDAEAAAKRLNTLLPGSVWAVSEQTEPPDE